MEIYPLLKTSHMALAGMSLLGFVLRFGWMVRASPLFGHKLSKVLPHLVDTLLLSAGVALAVLSQQAPWVVSWLGMKLLLLVLYILCGTLALKRAPTIALRYAAFACALAVFAQMVGVALRHSAWGWFA